MLNPLKYYQEKYREYCKKKKNQQKNHVQFCHLVSRSGSCISIKASLVFLQETGLLYSNIFIFSCIAIMLCWLRGLNCCERSVGAFLSFMVQLPKCASVTKWNVLERPILLSFKFAVIAFEIRAVSWIWRKYLSKHGKFNRLKGNFPQDCQSPMFK